MLYKNLKQMNTHEHFLSFCRSQKSQLPCMQAKCNEKISSENSSIPFMHYRGLDQFKMMKCSSPESQGHKMDPSQPMRGLHSCSLANQSVTSADDTQSPLLTTCCVPTLTLITSAHMLLMRASERGVTRVKARTGLM